MNIKKENGSMSIFVLVGLLFMTAFLIITYGSLSNKSKAISEQYNVVKGIYSWSDDYLEDAHYKSISIDFDKEEPLIVAKGATETLVATLVNEEDEDVNWKIDDETIARITQTDGNTITIEGLEIGETTITAEYERKIAKLKIMVIIDSTDFNFTYNNTNKTATVTGLSQKGQAKIASEVATLTIPDTLMKDGEKYTVTSIGSRAFYNCTNLNLTQIPSGVTSIGGNAFTNCANLVLTELPNGITEIEAGAFSGCSKLELTQLPSGVTYIGGSSFDGCRNLTLTELPSGITSIGGRAFYNCSKIALTEIPSGVTTIGANAFAGCANLVLTELPNGITRIESGAFSGCGKIALTELPSGVTYIGGSSFDGCRNLTLTELPSGITSIGGRAFYNCSKIALTEIPSGVTDIGELAFYSCTGLTSIIMHNAVNNIGNNAFGGYSNLSTINYTGTESEWNAITKGTSAIPTTTTINYNYITP